MIRKIATGTNNPALRQKAAEVKEITPEIKGLILDMLETMAAGNGIGLAAPQVGQPLRIIVARPDLAGKAIALINPKIIKKSFRKEAMEEGCLSLPGTYISVKRAKKITVEGLDIKNNQTRLKASGLWARVIQHEIEHCDGVLISDK